MLKPQDGTAHKVTTLAQKSEKYWHSVRVRQIFWQKRIIVERIFTIVDQQGEFVESQRAVRRHAEEGEELTRACGGGRCRMSQKHRVN